MDLSNGRASKCYMELFRPKASTRMQREPIFIYILRVEAWNVTFRTSHAFGVIRKTIEEGVVLMGSMRKIAIAVVMVSMVSTLAGCVAGKDDEGAMNSSGPIAQQTAGVSPSPSQEPTPSSSIVPSTPQPSAINSPVSTTKPQATASSKPTPAATVPSFSTAVDAKKVIDARAQEVIAALKEQNITKLASLVHPQKGVQFSPYSYIHTGTDIQVQGSNLAALWANASLTHWGTLDGSGDPIDLTFPNYWAKFVYNANFAAAPQISYNTIIGKGNMINNVFSVYPTTSYITVEYHFPGFDPQYQGMDWTSLRLVFEYSGSQWYVVAIVHDQHTI